MIDEPPLFEVHDDVPLDLQIEELKRELRMRNDVYPRWISTGTLKPGTAMRRTKALAAAIATLERLKASLQ